MTYRTQAARHANPPPAPVRRGARGARWPLAALALLLPALAWAQAGTQYRWQDKDGRTVFGDNPPADARNVKPIGSSATAVPTPLDGLPYELRRAAERYPVILITTANCAPCDSGRTLLRARGVPYAERTIATTEDRAAYLQRGGGDQVPALLVGTQKSIGFESGAWHGMLDLAGYPRDARLPVTWKPPASRPLAEPEGAATPAGASPAAPTTPPAR